jgi:hypothetical protein
MYIDSGETHSRLDVASHQLLGFIASLLPLQPFVKDMGSVVRSFVPNHIAWAAARRCVFLGILKMPGTPQDGFQLAPSLSSGEATIFWRVLPVCDYNAQMALYLSLPSNSSITLAVKLDLAAIMTVDVRELFIFGPRALNDTRATAREALEACHSLTRELATSGTAWLLVGLWQRCMASLEQDPEELKKFRGGLFTFMEKNFSFPTIRTQIEPIVAYQAWPVLVELRKIMSKIGLPSHQRLELSLSLPDGGVKLLQEQLLHCFIHHLGVMAPSNGQMMVCDFTSGCMAISSSSGNSLVDWNALMQSVEASSSSSRLFGVHISPLGRVSRSDDREFFSDWNSIPRDVYAHWIHSRPEGRPLDLLRTGFSSHANTDEL